MSGKNKNNPNKEMADLPNEIMQHIEQYLDYQDTLNTSHSSTFLYTANSHHLLEKKKFAEIEKNQRY